MPFSVCTSDPFMFIDRNDYDTVPGLVFRFSYSTSNLFLGKFYEAALIKAQNQIREISFDVLRFEYGCKLDQDMAGRESFSQTVWLMDILILMF